MNVARKNIHLQTEKGVACELICIFDKKLGIFVWFLKMRLYLFVKIRD